MRVLISGFGTVGQGFAEVLILRKDFFRERYGKDVNIVCAMDSSTYVSDQSGLSPKELLERKKSTGKVGKESYQDPLKIMDSVDYDLLVEVSPTDIRTGGAGLKNIRHALESGKDVITVNKGPLALKFCELIALARKNNCKFRFEGSVGGAMPIINLCRESLVGENISSIRGILNGTCNFILSKMDNGQSFEQALKEAQQMGYAETDPTNDVEGYDSACKVVILANSIFRRNVTFSDVKITGITSITGEAVSLAASHNMVIRLIGEVSGDKLEVAPRLVPRGHPLSITGTLNAAQVVTDLAGPITISGRGAGRIETASAILSDLVSIMDDRKEPRGRCPNP
jgi:homoserine dehydrogenase